MEGKIYIITHIRIKVPMIEGHEEYEIIQTGKNDVENLGYQQASTGENIAQDNTFYADMTVHYWIWKNCCYDYVGVNHYSRYLFYDHHLITGQEISNLLEKYDVLVPRKAFRQFKIEEQWDRCHYHKDLVLAAESIARRYPDCVDSFNKIMQSNGLYTCNIFIAKQATFNAYCNWVFPILEDVKNRIDLSDYPSDSARRIGGFLSERLFNVWLYYQKKSTYELELKTYSKSEFIIT